MLRVLLVGFCALVLATEATAATNVGNGKGSAKTREAAKEWYQGLSLAERLDWKLDAARRHRSVIRFFANHRWLLGSGKHGPIARTALRRATRQLAEVTRTMAAIRRVLREREQRRLLATSPRAAICNVFGRYCRQALAVAWCESRYSTTARNGQYLGLFQMGWYERRLFGHGRTALAQAIAAHRYFVLSGRDWSPWGCKPGYV